MATMTVLSIFVSLCAFFSYINFRFIKLPSTIGVMVLSLIASLALLLFPAADGVVVPLIENVDFSNVVLHGMLSFLLFAGALHVDFQKLKENRLIILFLAIVGTLFSTFAVGWLTYFLLNLLGIQIDFIYTLLFGALISPTDPIAVLSILKKAGIPKSLEIKVVGESLFNDGVAVVIFMVLVAILAEGSVEPSRVLILFVEEVFGGVALGGALGFIVYKLMSHVDNYKVEVFLTLALVMGGFELAQYLHVSGPIAMVVAGLIIGNIAHNKAMSQKTRDYLNGFWELIDEFLNVLLFMLIGFELLVVSFDSVNLLVGIILIPVLLLVRYVASLASVLTFQKFIEFTPGTVNILTWGGLRGGLSVALALSLPDGPERNGILIVTYTIVVFSILVQGLTIGKLAKRYA